MKNLLFFNKKEMLDRIRTEEDKILFSNTLDLLNRCLIKGEPTFTDFLDPVKCRLFMDSLNKQNKDQFFCRTFGGYEGCERAILGFSTGANDLTDEAFPIEVISIGYNGKFSRELTHRDYLGSVLGLGIDRALIGDIVMNKEEPQAFLFCHRDMVEYIAFNLESVGRTKVKVKQEKLASLAFAVDEGKKQDTIIVASLRLDVVIAAGFHMSRSKALEWIRGEKVYVNWKMVNNASCQVQPGDRITLRGMGKMEIAKITGKTKKDRIVLSILK